MSCEPSRAVLALVAALVVAAVLSLAQTGVLGDFPGHWPGRAVAFPAPAALGSAIALPSIGSTSIAGQGEPPGWRYRDRR